MSPALHPLDNPAWHALRTHHAHLAQGDGQVLRYLPEVSPFAGVHSPGSDAWSAMAALLQPGETVALIAGDSLPQAGVLQTECMFQVRQMLDTGSSLEIAASDDVVRLGPQDVPEMLALAQRTQPGPFNSRTLDMGRYLGVRHEGRLMAMAGERLRLDGYTEISAVCVDEARRGKGLAQRLMNMLRSEIRARGDVPFLHVRDDLSRTAGLYEHMGFVTRGLFGVWRVKGLG